MPWKDTSVKDVRYNFILAVLENVEPFIDVCRAFGISPKTGYKWVKRFELEGREGLKDKSRRPLSRPRNTAPEIESTIISTKLNNIRWGPKKILQILKTQDPEVNWPSLTTVANILKRNGYVVKRHKRAKLAATASLKGASASNDLWSADFKGWWKTLDGHVCQPFTLLDTHSRYLLSCHHVDSTDTKSVKALLKETFQEFGMPLRLRTDNGPPFASRSAGRLTRLAIWLIKLGITPEWITPGKPQENGVHERMHRTLKLEAAQPPKESLKEQQMELAKFQYAYNFSRPHEALELNTPNSVYVPSTRKWTGDENTISYGDKFEIRRIDKRGNFYWKGSRFFISELLYGETVGIIGNEKDLNFEVYFGPILLGRIDPIRGYRNV